jgi:SAM-dependent methyltransferase
MLELAAGGFTDYVSQMVSEGETIGAPSVTDVVPRFWDRQAQRYNGDRRGDNHHQHSADLIEPGLHGEVLSIGGLWAAADIQRVNARLTVADSSAGMLKQYAEAGLSTLLADARSLPVASAAYDHVVMPLVLHHIAGNNGAQARKQARRALQEAVRVTKPGGQVWIKEIVVSRAVYLPELVLSPLTKAMLALADIPLVIFHPLAFYRSVLLELGCRNVQSWQSAGASERWNDWIAPVIGLPRLKVPRIAYPVRYVLVCARVG